MAPEETRMQVRSDSQLLAGRYRVGELLGRGGMAEVYAGFDERLDRPVAIKLLRPEMAARPGVRERFEGEALAAARLSHPNVVAVYDAGEDGDRAYIVMERLPGDTLADRLGGGPVDPEWLRAIAGDALGALGAAHAAGLVHRDVKPGNILISAEGCAKVADFGIAKSLEVAGVDLTGTNQLVGTPAYLAPERIDGQPASPRSDLYALGVVLYEALTEVRPFTGDTPLAVAYSVRHADVVPVAERRPDVPADLAAVVDRAMQREPARRFATASEMAAALGVGAAPGGAATAATAAADATVPAVPVDNVPGDAGPTRVIPAAEIAATADLSAPPRPVAGPRRVALLAGGLLLLVLLGLLFLGGRGGRGGAEGGSGGDGRAQIAAGLREVAEDLGPYDGPRGPESAVRLRQVADAVEAGGGSDAANAMLQDVATWRRDGQLSPAATAAITTALLRVPGTDVANLTPATTARPPPPPAPARDDGGGDREEDERQERRGKGKKGDD
jgi:hypothetical protein